MALGGAERALLGLLNAIDTEKVDVDLFINQHTGEFMSLIPSKINLLPELKGYNAIERPMKTILKEGQLGILYGRIKARFQHNMYKKSLDESKRSFDSSGLQYIANDVEPFLKSLNNLGEYDLAISFLRPHNIVLNKVKAKKKIAWIHTDYSTVHVNAKLELPVWSRFDYIASISPDCTRSFLKTFPSLEDKIIEIENILSSSFIQNEAENCQAKELYGIDYIKILSIGRFDYAKNYDNVPDITRRIVEQVPNFRWFIIGFGEDEDLIHRKITEEGMQNHVILLGKKSNPYPYIKACDIYVQPSRYEGKSVTVREAQILHKPVVVTNYPTAASQIKDGVDGIIVPMDNEGCAQGIISFIENNHLQEKIISHLNSHDYGNEGEVEKIYSLL